MNKIDLFHWRARSHQTIILAGVILLTDETFILAGVGLLVMAFILSLRMQELKKEIEKDEVEH